jgi:RecA/RadA recombinase
MNNELQPSSAKPAPPNGETNAKPATTSANTKAQAAQSYSAREVNERIRSLAIRRGNGHQVGDCVWTGIKFFDERNAPMTRGTVTCIVGETNHGKSPLAATIAYNVKESIKRAGTSGAVVMFLTEETVEKREVQMWGDSRLSLRRILTGGASLEVVDENIQKSNDDPLYFIGDSADIATADTRDETLGTLTPMRIGVTLQKLIRELKVQPELVVVDHVHDLQLERPPRDEGELYESIGRQLIALASALRPYCPILFVCQAKKDVANRPGVQRVPESTDIKFMSSLIHKARDIYAISYPKKYLGGKSVSAANGEYQASTGIFLVRGAKLRDGDAGELCAMTALDENGRWRGLLTELGAGSVSAPQRNAASAPLARTHRGDSIRVAAVSE